MGPYTGSSRTGLDHQASRFCGPSGRAPGRRDVEPSVAGIRETRACSRSRLTPMRLLTLAFIVALLSGCTSQRGVSPDSDRAQLSALQERVEAAPDDAMAFRQLGDAYIHAGEILQAYDALRRAERLDPDHDQTYFAIALLEEALGNQAEALARYQDAPRSSMYFEPMQARAAWLEKDVAEADIAVILEDSDTARSPPLQEAVAVFPFTYTGRDPRDRPLARGLSELLASDLAATGRIRIVDGLRVQTLLDQLDLDPAMIDSPQAQQLGRLLRTSHSVQGTLGVQYDAVTLEASLIPSGREPSPEPSMEKGTLQDLFRLEKHLALELVGRLGIQLSSPERTRLLNRIPTENLEAFFFFSRGLLAEDEGLYSEAAALYSEATARDPGFAAAAQRAGDVALLATDSVDAYDVLAALRPPNPQPYYDLVGGRLEALSRNLGAHFIPGEGAREPAAEIAPTTPGRVPFSVPPDPPGSSGN